MNFLVTAEQMKVAESNAVHRGVSLWNLAENAATACFGYIKSAVPLYNEKTYTVLCGRGMNGGDGMLIASLIGKAGGEVVCVFVDGYPQSGPAYDIFLEYGDSLVKTVYADNPEKLKAVLRNSHVIIDCVYGTGFHGDLESKPAELFGFINGSLGGSGSAGGLKSPNSLKNLKNLKISVDLPSGVNADTGERAENAFIPDVTIVIGAYKKGLLSHPCRDFCGELVFGDIDLTRNDFTSFEAIYPSVSILAQKPGRHPSSHKGTHGRLLNIAGSERYIGAALLSTRAAIKTGAGIVTLAAPKSVISSVAPAVPEAVFAPADIKSISAEMQSADAISLGCGLGNTSETRKITEFVIRNATCPVILDADGINSISDNINVLKDNKSLILTPHPAEFARITGLSVADVQRNRVDYAKTFAKEAEVILVLKGVNTVTAFPNGAAVINPTGNAGLAKAGTGDVLTGTIAALAAQKVPLREAAVLGVYLHGTAAERLAQRGRPLSGITASEIAEELGSIL